MTETQKILLTGITGFLGSHIAIQLLDKGYEVRGTLRDITRAESMRTIIAAHAKHIDKLSFFAADLTDAPVWDDATRGMNLVIHVASPLPQTLPKHENDLIIPAKEGTLNVMRAASKNGVRRVVLTSSTAAIVYGKERDQRSGWYDEDDWTDLTCKADTTPYPRSKTIAEKAAWDFFAKDDRGMDLVTVCPGTILGPVLESDTGTSANIVIKLMDGSSPGIPRIGFDVVDVRSVADLHIKAMEAPAAAGERFIGSAGFLSFQDIADILRREYPDRKIPKHILPDWFVRLYSFVEPKLKPILNDLSVERRVDHSKAERLLGWKPIPPGEAVLGCAESLCRLNLV
jgi:dihydroflavonol-4-reductase